MKTFITIGLLLMSLLHLSACGGGGGAAAPAPEPAPAAGSLTVASKSPADGATQKSDYPIVAVFSAPVDQTTVDSSTFQVSGNGSTVNGVVTFSEDRTVAIFTPAADLVDGVTYTASLSTAIRSTANEALVANQSWSFTASDKANYSCTITAPPPSLGLAAYYTKYCDANGMPVIGGNLVTAAALQKAWLQTMNMMKMRQDLHAEMVKRGTKVAIVADGEGITSIPEYADLDTVFPLDGGQSWDDRARGLGATAARPISSGAEENLLCYGGDPYYGENIFIHEFAHTVEGMGLDTLEPDFRATLTAAYNAALAAGKYANTYADDTVYEYWAEGVQNWFDVNLQADPADGIHNTINTRDELKVYDPTLYNLLSRVFPADWKPVACP